MDPADRTVVRVGTILEFRKSRRSLNRLGLVRLAQKLFSRRPEDIIYIGFESVLERAVPFPESGRVDSAG